MLKHLSLFLAFAIFFMSHAYASVETGTDNKANYKMKYPLVYTTNKAAQDRINQDIYRYIAAFRNDHNSGKFYEGQFFYKTKYEDDDVVSLVIQDYRYNAGAAHGYTYSYGLVYDKRTGQRIPLSNYLRITLSDLRWFYTSHVYGLDGEKAEPFAQPDRVSQDYFLLGKGGVALIYDPYEIGPYTAGTLTIRFTAKDIDYFNRRNK